MGVLLGRSPADVQVLVTWAVAVVPSGMSLSGPDISLDYMRLEVVSEEIAGSDPSEPLAVGVSDPLGLFAATGPATTAACSPVTSDEVAGRGADPAPGAGRLLAGSNELPELASSLALRLPASWTDDHWEALDPPPGVVLRLGHH